VRAAVDARGGLIRLPDGSAEVVFPAVAVAQDTAVQLARLPPPTSGGQQLVSNAIDPRASDPSGEAGVTLSQPFRVTLAYAGTPPVGMFFFDTITSAWQPVQGGSTVNLATGTVTGIASNFMIIAALTAPTTAVPTLTSVATPTPHLGSVASVWVERDHDRPPRY
jgi:hypothetical protein